MQPLVAISEPVWPETGWTSDTKELPTVNADVILGHLLKTGKRVPGEENVLVAQKPLRRGYDFYWGGYVHDVLFFRNPRDANKAFITGKCWASQKKYTKYEQKVVLEQLEGCGELAEEPNAAADRQRPEKHWAVTFATCTPCVAGQHGGFCQHVFALLLALENHVKQGSDKLPGPQSITSARQQWGPRSRNVEPQRVMESVVEKARPDEERKRPPISSLLKEARGPAVRTISVASVNKVEKSLPPGCRMAGIIKLGNDPPRTVPSRFGPCMEGCALSYQVKELKEPTANIRPAQPSTQLHSFPALPCPRQGTKVQEQAHAGRRQLPLQVAQRLQQRTMGQSSNLLWKKLHQFILTASNFHKALSSRTPSESFLSAHFLPKNLDHVPAIAHGQKFESAAVVDYVALKKAAGNPVVVAECGLSVSCDDPFLGASPDRLAFDVTSKSHGLV